MNGQPTPLQLSGQQRALYEALSEKDERLAGMYLGSLLVLRQIENPDLLALAAHGLRELMEKLPRYLDLPVAAKPPSLKEKVRSLLQSWGSAARHSQCLLDPAWSGAIDGPLRKFLKRTQEFFSWFESEHPTRKQQTAKVLRSLDPINRPLPAPIEQLRIEEWDKCHNYFEGVSHHTILLPPEDFTSWLAVLERFLLDRLRPRTFEDHTEIDRIISEGEANA
jgi:hypothetical protein